MQLREDTFENTTCYEYSSSENEELR